MNTKYLLLGLIAVALGSIVYLQLTKERTGVVAVPGEVIVEVDDFPIDLPVPDGDDADDEPVPDGTSKPRTDDPEPKDPAPVLEAPQVVASGLQIPWDVVFLPDGDMLVTERVGRLTRVTPQGEKTTVTDVSVSAIGEAGLLGVVLHPQFASNNYLYLYRTTNVESLIENSVERYTFNPATNELSGRTVILDGIPGAQYHDGGRMAFGPDGKLYVTTGDATNDRIAQDLNSLGGKILRMNADGSVPADNPFPGSLVYSYGHRNPQALSWDRQGRLWSTEHGPSFPTFCCRDEVNLIEAGANYGWPEITDDEVRAGMMGPFIHSGNSTTWAPAGGVVVGDYLYFPGLRGEALYSVQIIGAETVNPPPLKQYFKNEYGRLRTVVLGPDGMLYLTTSNRDGRGTVRQGDDKIIRIDPRTLK